MSNPKTMQYLQGLLTITGPRSKACNLVQTSREKEVIRSGFFQDGASFSVELISFLRALGKLEVSVRIIQAVIMFSATIGQGRKNTVRYLLCHEVGFGTELI